MQTFGTKKTQNLFGQKNPATSWDNKKLCNLLGQKKSRNLLGHKKSRNFLRQKITQPLGTKKITQPLGGKSHAGRGVSCKTSCPISLKTKTLFSPNIYSMSKTGADRQGWPGPPGSTSSIVSLEAPCPKVYQGTFMMSPSHC